MNLGDPDNAISYYREGIKWQLQYDRIYDSFVGKLLLAFALEHGEEKITLLKETIEYFRSIQDEHRLAESMNVLFESLAKASLFDQAIEIYQELLEILKHKSIDLNLAMAHKTMGEILIRRDTAFHDLVQSEILLKQSIDIFRELGVKDSLYQTLEIYSRLLEEEKRWEEYSRTFKEFHDLKHEVLSTEVQMKLHALEDQRKRDLEEHERKIQKIQIEEQEKLLHNVLPPEIAVKILAGEHNIADLAESVSVFFFDIVGFTEISRMMSPRELLEGLNRIFTHIDALAIEHSIEKIKTIGDAYLAVSGIHKPIRNHAEQIANFALAIQKQSKEWSLGGTKISFRMGIHCGPVISGIIGSQRFAFDVWGDTVNIASRMESNGQPGKIHVTEDYAELLNANHQYACIHRGKIDVKGRGFINTFWLESGQ
jgi:class 3 adenylate cyclase